MQIRVLRIWLHIEIGEDWLQVGWNEKSPREKIGF